MDSSNSWLTPSVIWFFLGIVIFLFELAAPGFILFFFGLGAFLVAVLLLFFDLPLVWQLLIFLSSSIVFIITLRRKFTLLFEGFIHKKADPSKNIDDYTGKRVRVIEGINPPNRGKVELYGSSWIAEAAEAIPAGSTVEIVAKENIVLTVKPITD
jgi:membrane protein implicated in regulation of membrane protease activity